MTKAVPPFETTLGPICEYRQGAWHLDLAELPLIHGLSVLSRGLADILSEDMRSHRGEITVERRLRLRENPELLELFGVGYVRLHLDEEVSREFIDNPRAIENHLRTILGTLQRQRYRSLLLADAPERKALVFEFDLNRCDDRCRAILERCDAGGGGSQGFLRITFERVGYRNLDLRTLAHVRVHDLERRHFLAGSTRIAQTWRQGLRREAERGHRLFVERRVVHDHLFVQFQRAGLFHIERVEIHWGDSEVSLLLESETRVLDHDLKRVLLALEDDGVRERLMCRETLEIKGRILNGWLDLVQCSRVLRLSLGCRRERGEIAEFLERMPALKTLVAKRRQTQPLARVEVLLIHHMTAEVLGVIAALRALGCRRLTTLFVAYAGEAPGSYLGPLLELPAEEFRAFALARIPDATRAEGRYRLSRQYSDLAGMEALDARIQETTSFYDAMSQVARVLLIDSARRAESENQALLLLEDGGYLAPALHLALHAGQSIAEFVGATAELGAGSMRDLLGDRLKGSVEHTRNGHDRLRAVAERKAMAFPSLSIAISHLKRGPEAREVALSILQAVESILHAAGRILSRRHTLVLGSRGAIGSWLVRFLMERAEQGARQVAGLDLVAEPDAEYVEADTFANLPVDCWRNCDLILGVIGASVLDEAALADWLLKGRPSELWIASGSTKTVEFEDLLAFVTALRNAQAPRLRGLNVEIRTSEILDPITNRLFGTRHRFVIELPDGKQRVRDLCFLGQLMPINFLYYGVPTELIDDVLTALIRAGLGLVERPNLASELYAVDHEVDADGHKLPDF